MIIWKIKILITHRIHLELKENNLKKNLKNKQIEKEKELEEKRTELKNIIFDDERKISIKIQENKEKQAINNSKKKSKTKSR